MSYNSKYTGAQVEEFLDQIANGEIGGGITEETDPIFSASPAASITEEKKEEWDNKMDKVTLATVATSGSYNDLSDKPAIPSAVTESTVSGWGFTKNTGTYSKPSGGIPKTDLASTVQTSLGKADTALQSYTEQYKGTVTKVKINGSEKSPDSDGVVDLGKIEGGGSNNGTKEIVVLESKFAPGGNELQIVNFEPNKIYICNEALRAIYFKGFVTNDSLNNEYILHFKAGEYGCAIGIPDSWLWPNGEIPYVIDCYCELSIVTTYIGDEYIYKCVLTPFKSLV